MNSSLGSGGTLYREALADLRTWFPLSGFMASQWEEEVLDDPFMLTPGRSVVDILPLYSITKWRLKRSKLKARAMAPACLITCREGLGLVVEEQNSWQGDWLPMDSITGSQPLDVVTPRGSNIPRHKGIGLWVTWRGVSTLMAFSLPLDLVSRSRGEAIRLELAELVGS